MVQEDAKGPPRTRLFSTAKALVEIAVVWNVLGYISLRAFCNYHDVPLIPGLGVERYLQETYALLFSLAIPKTQTVGFLVAILGISARIPKV